MSRLPALLLCIFALADSAAAAERCSLDGASVLGDRLAQLRERVERGPAAEGPDAENGAGVGPPAWRPLTAGEIQLARRVFKDAIDHTRVRIYRGKWLRWQPDDAVMSPNGHVYFPRGHADYRDDFADAWNWEVARETFWHELAHVYQHHQGVHVAERRLREGGIYRYEISPAKDLNAYTIEQQAEILSDFAVRCTPLSSFNFPTCRDRFMPALGNFLADPGYLRAAEKRRLLLERWGVTN